MVNERNFYGTPEVAAQLGIGLKTLQAWVHRHPEHRPTGRISDDMLWTVEEIERVIEARSRTAKHGNRKAKTTS